MNLIPRRVSGAVRYIALSGVLVSWVAHGQNQATTSAASEAKIRDNLFLLEEAYNQEPGVIQHIQSYVFHPRDRSWAYSFTEEWPAITDLHQLSVTVAMLSDDLRALALGDLMLNYRLQAYGVGGESAVAVAPRVSLVLPTGDSRRGTGRGVLGVQLNAPVSIELSQRFVLHLNAGLTFTPGAKSPDGRADTALDTNLGAALVWLPLSTFNCLVEFQHLSTVEVGDDATSRRSDFVINPGVRFAINLGSLQVVPGLSAPIQLSTDGVEFGALAYLSLEHPLWSP